MTQRRCRRVPEFPEELNRFMKVPLSLPGQARFHESAAVDSELRGGVASAR